MVYVLREVKLHLASGGRIYVQTPDAEDNLLMLGWDADDVRELIYCLDDGCYHKSEWAKTGNKQWLACDAYAIAYDDSQKVKDSRFPHYYLKFGFANNVAHCGIISCHLSP